MLDQAFEALKTYDWGQDKGPLQPIEDAVVATHGDAVARAELEQRLAAVLATDVPYDAKQYVCRRLQTIGTAASVPALAALLTDEKLSHMARYALERIPAPEAAQAMRDALPRTRGKLKIGMISSLGVRRDEASVPAMAALLGDADAAVARAAAMALGDIGTATAVKALASKPADAEARLIANDALLACAERSLAQGKKAEAMAIYKGLAGTDQPKQVRLAATRGLLLCAGGAR